MGRRRLTIAAMVGAILMLLVTASWAAVPPRHPAAAKPPAHGGAGGGGGGVAPHVTPFTAPLWSTVWGTAMSSADYTISGVAAQPGATFRQVLHMTAAGTTVRLRLTNRFGYRTTVFGHVTLAYAAHAQPGVAVAAAAGPLRQVLFHGSARVAVTAGADTVSDQIAMPVTRGTDLLVSIWIPGSGAPSYHPFARQTTWIAAGPADHAAEAAAVHFKAQLKSWFYVDAVEATGVPGTVVALGDSITDGVRSGVGLNHRWTDYLAGWLAAAGKPGYGIVNSGISGNRVRVDGAATGTEGPAALTRIGPDVTARAGARTVVLLEGINDIMEYPMPATASQLTDALAQVARECHEAGLRVVGGTLMPYKGWKAWNPIQETMRQDVNLWIRSGGDGSFDAVADFDAAVRDPADPQQLAATYDGGDHLHPSDAGDEALAAAVPLDAL